MEQPVLQRVHWRKCMCLRQRPEPSKRNVKAWLEGGGRLGQADPQKSERSPPPPVFFRRRQAGRPRDQQCLVSNLDSDSTVIPVPGDRPRKRLLKSPKQEISTGPCIGSLHAKPVECRPRQAFDVRKPMLSARVLMLASTAFAIRAKGANSNLRQCSQPIFTLSISLALGWEGASPLCCSPLTVT